MDTVAWPRALAVMDGALDVPEPERAAFVAHACGEDVVLRAAVERLLYADALAVSFLERPPANLGEAFAEAEALPPDADVDATLDAMPFPEPEPGTRLGPYRLIRRIGHGGMGTVYLARRDDEVFERRVAIKVAKRVFADRGDVVRFRRERQILASLDHPNIARLYDGGATPDGRPFLVMEHVDGTRIDAYCDAQRLSVRARVALFRKVCAAVEDAHRNLVVHRDLKPANILVRADGEPVLLDFGIAKVLAPEDAPATVERTDTGLRPMTPAYASPEQIRGGTITTASDVYALGLLLYQLLAGARAFPNGAAREAPPPRPSVALGEGKPAAARCRDRLGMELRAARRALAGDLDAVVAKALREDPDQRYGTAAELADDLERHLHGRALTARGDAFAYRLVAFLRRHRVAAALAAAVVALATGFGVVATYQARQVARERDRVARERDDRDRVVAFMVELFEVDPAKREGPTVTVDDILKNGFERIQGEFAGADPTLRAALFEALAEASTGLGRFPEAADALTAALAIHRGLGVPERIAESCMRLARVETELLRVELAEAHYREAFALLGQGSWTPESPNRAQVLVELAQLFRFTNRLEEHRDTAHLALSATHRADPVRFALALAESAIAYGEQGELRTGVRMLREGLVLLADEPKGAAPTIDLQANLALLYLRFGNLRTAGAVLDEATDLARRTLEPHDPRSAALLLSATLYQYMAGDSSAAMSTAREAIVRDANARDGRVTPLSMLIQARILAWTGRSEQAEGLLSIFLGESRIPHAEPAEDWLQVPARILLARILQESGRGAEARPHLEAAGSLLEIAEAREAPLARIADAASLCFLDGRADAARALAERVIRTGYYDPLLYTLCRENGIDPLAWRPFPLRGVAAIPGF